MTAAVVYVGVGLVAVRSWLKARDSTHGWLAATLGVLALVALAGRILPEHSVDPTVLLARKLLVALLVFFPFFLLRFAGTFRALPAWFDRLTLGITLALAVGIFFFPRLPEQGEPRPPAFQFYVIVLVLHWALLSVVVTIRLWRSGRGQPNVARNRMRILGLGSAGLAIILVIAGFTTPTRDPATLQIATQLLSLAIGPFFLFGFAPPRAIIGVWRRSEEVALRDATKGLMQAASPAEVSAILLPHGARLLGGSGSVLSDLKGKVIGHFGVSREQAEKIIQVADLQGSGRTPNGIISIPLEFGRLSVEASPYAPFFGEEEIEVLGVLGTLAELALARVQQMIELRDATQAMREFVAIASHDLRTPITVIKGMALTLQNRSLELTEEEKQKGFESIVRQSNRLARLVEELLILAKIESGNLLGEGASIDLKTTTLLLLDEAGGRDGFEVRIPDGLTVQIDLSYLERILSNYIHNARAYGAPPYSVEAQETDGMVEIRVIDHGAGVSPEFESRLFDKFARADKQESKRTEGTGLGLSIVRGLSRSFGGDAWYERLVPVGSSFAVRIPRAKSASDGGR